MHLRWITASCRLLGTHGVKYAATHRTVERPSKCTRGMRREARPSVLLQIKVQAGHALRFLSSVSEKPSIEGASPMRSFWRPSWYRKYVAKFLPSTPFWNIESKLLGVGNRSSLFENDQACLGTTKKARRFYSEHTTRHACDVFPESGGLTHEATKSTRLSMVVLTHECFGST